LAQVGDPPHGGAGGVNLDLSASLAPLGPSPAAVAAARRAPVDAYPERDCASLIAAAAADMGVAESRVAAGAGASDLLLRVCLAHLRPGDVALLVAPCFGEYGRAATAAGGRVVHWRCREEEGFRVDPAAVAETARRHGAVLGMLARPASPTGVDVPAAVIAELRAAAPGVLWVVDEAFLGLTDRGASVAGGDAVVVRSLTKELALAGLRVAVADATPARAQALRSLAPPWCVSAPAIAAARAGLADRAHRQAGREASRREREALTGQLAALGIATTDAVANFVCARVGDAAGFVSAMRDRGIAVRRCDDFGMPGWVRMAVPPPARRAEVLGAVARALDATAEAPVG
jgi:histidinol-phosphate aminotransferase